MTTPRLPSRLLRGCLLANCLEKLELQKLKLITVGLQHLGFPAFDSSDFFASQGTSLTRKKVFNLQLDTSSFSLDFKNASFIPRPTRRKGTNLGSLSLFCAARCIVRQKRLTQLHVGIQCILSSRVGPVKWLNHSPPPPFSSPWMPSRDCVSVACLDRGGKSLV